MTLKAAKEARREKRKVEDEDVVYRMVERCKEAERWVVGDVCK